jgi:predicted nucleic acid-binding protein
VSDFLDASVLVEACLLQSGKFDKAESLLAAGARTSGHALAEAYATLSGDRRLKINPRDAARMVADCAARLEVGDLGHTRILSLISESSQRGIRGGSFYDAIHADVARCLGCKRIHTLNPSHFRHVAPDLEVLPL